MMSKRTELLILATILILVFIFSVLPIFIYSPFQNTYSFDFWSHLIRVQQYDVEHFINYDIDYSNVWRVEGGSTYYPPGFSLFLYSIYSVADTNLASLNMISSFMWVFFCLIIFLFTRKAFNNGKIALISTFFGATLISGSNMLGPYFPHPSIFSVLFILLAMMGLLFSKNQFHRILIPTLFLSAVFLSHRPSTLIWLIFIPFIVVGPLLFIKEKRRYITTFSITAINVTFLAMLISLLHWGNMPIDIIMRGGGISQERFDIMLGFELTKPIFFTIVSVLSAIFIVLLPLFTPSWDAENYPQMKSIYEFNISKHRFHFLMLLLPIFIVLLLVFYVISSGIETLNPILIWGSLSSSAHTNALADNIKKFLYIWHINIIPLLFVSPSVYLLLKSNKRHSLSAFSICVIFSLLFMFIIETYSFEIKIQRVYLYLAPFIYMLCGWGAYYYIKHYKMDRITKLVFTTLAAVSILLLLITIPNISSPVSNERVDTLNWTEVHVDETEILGTESLGVYARATGQFNYVTLYGLVSLDNSYSLSNYLRTQDVSYVFVEGETYQEKLNNLSVYCIYQEEKISGYFIGG